MLVRQRVNNVLFHWLFCLLQISYWPRGKGLGGSGQMNYMLHYPGVEKDFEQWEALGAVGWSYKNIQNYMNKAMGLKYEEEFEKLKKSQKRGEKRLFVTSQDVYSNALLKTFVDAGNEIIYPRVSVKKGESTVKNGKRWSSYNGYLENVLDKENLKVLLTARVSKVVFDESSVTRGVEVVLHNDETRVVNVKFEVILSAGAVHSPQILMLSGVGPKHHLQRLQVSVKQVHRRGNTQMLKG